MLDRFIQAEAVDPYDLDLRGFLHTLGIEKGGTFDPGQAWINTFAGENTEFQSSSTYTNLEQRTGFFTSAYSDSPGMVVNVVGKGAKYPRHHERRQRRLARWRQVLLAAPAARSPAALFWSVALFDNVTAVPVDQHDGQACCQRRRFPRHLLRAR